MATTARNELDKRLEMRWNHQSKRIEMPTARNGVAPSLQIARNDFGKVLAVDEKKL